MNNPTAGRRWIAGIVGVVVTVSAFVFGRNVGYDHGFNVAYTTEHSHYLYEKNRGDHMQKRIDTQRACVNDVVRHMSPIQDSGFPGLAELMSNIKTILSGSVSCDRRADFGTMSPAEATRLLQMPQ